MKDDAYLRDILRAASIIQQHTAGASSESFLSDLRTQDAVARRFEIIGEAAGHLSPATLRELPGVPWRLLVGMRNILIHNYDEVDPQRVWKTVREGIPPLIRQLEGYLADRPQEPNPDS